MLFRSNTEFKKSWSYWRHSEKLVQRKKLKVKDKDERIKSRRKKEKRKKRPEMVQINRKMVGVGKRKEKCVGATWGFAGWI